MVARQWKGIARREHAADYIAHLRRDTFPHLATLAGFRCASILHRDVPSGTEFLIVTEWESLSAIRAFAGDDVERAVVPESVGQMMVDYDRVVTHYEIAERFPSSGLE